MSLIIINIRSFIFACLLITALKVSAQDTIQDYILDTSFFQTVSLKTFLPSFNYIYHSPDKKDQKLYKAHKSLIRQQPTSKNHKIYFSLACSLWELGKIQEAEKMFLRIVNSTEEYFTSAYYHSSDISGDQKESIYGYGRFTSNYKNYAAIYLTKIYLEQKGYDKALQFLEDAVKKYKVTYTCGTGFHRQQDEYDFLYASCYKGLKKDKEVIELLLPSCLSRNDEIIIAAIKNTYSKTQILEYLLKAESSIECSLDTFPSFIYQTTYSEAKEEKTDTIKYYSGTATIKLFGKKINMPVPDLENEEHLTKEHLLNFFRESEFYTRLKNDTFFAQDITE